MEDKNNKELQALLKELKGMGIKIKKRIPTKKEMVAHGEWLVLKTERDLEFWKEELKHHLKNPFKSTSEHKEFTEYIKHYVAVYEFELESDKSVLEKTKKSKVFK